MDRLFQMSLRQAHNYREFWVCSSCGTPRRLGIFHFTRDCRKCGSGKPAIIVIQKKRHPWDKESLSRSAKSRLLLGMTRRALSHLGVGKSLGEVLESVRPKRKSAGKFSGWFTQVRFRKRLLQGILDFDVCLTSTPELVRKYMAKTKMMQIRIPEDLHKWFKKYAHEYETTMTTVFITYLERLKARSTKKYEVDQI